MSAAVVEASRRDALRSDDTEVNFEVNSYDIKCIQLAIVFAHVHLHGTSIMHLIKGYFGPTTRTILSFDSVYAIKEINRYTQMKRMK